MNINKAFIAGNLTRDPEARTLPSGSAVCNFGIATNRVWTNQAGERQEDTQFHNIVTFGKLAEICTQYLKKGRLVFIEGRLQTRSWDDQDGNKRYRTEIIADTMQMGPRPAGVPGGEAPDSPASPTPTSSPTSPTDKDGKDSKKTDDQEIKIEDIPF